MLRFIAGVAASLLALSTTAQAADLAGPEVEFYPGQFAAELAAAEAPVDVLDSLSGETQISMSDLDTSRGGISFGDVQVNNATNNGNASNNSLAGDIDTGTIGDTSINNASGFNTLMLNTGNNVVMQSITEVNIILKN